MKNFMESQLAFILLLVIPICLSVFTYKNFDHSKEKYETQISERDLYVQENWDKLFPDSGIKEPDVVFTDGFMRQTSEVTVREPSGERKKFVTEDEKLLKYEWNISRAAMSKVLNPVLYFLGYLVALGVIFGVIGIWLSSRAQGSE